MKKISLFGKSCHPFLHVNLRGPLHKLRHLLFCHLIFYLKVNIRFAKKFHNVAQPMAKILLT